MLYHGLCHKSLVFSRYTQEPLGECVVYGGISQESVAQVFYLILYYAIENTVANTINAAHDGRV